MIQADQVLAVVTAHSIPCKKNKINKNPVYRDRINLCAIV